VAAAEAIVAEGYEAIAISADLSQPDASRELIDAAVARCGRIDAVIHNAGITTRTPIAELAERDVDAMLRLHLGAAASLSAAAWPVFSDQGGGRLLFITSSAGLYGASGNAHYGAAKAGLVGLARVAALEGGPSNIAANVLGVAAHTPMVEQSFAGTTDWLGWSAEHLRPDPVSAAATWLVHPDCTANGRIYHAFGGHVARVVIAETAGITDLDLTPEVVRDRFAEIDEMTGLVMPETRSGFWTYVTATLAAAGVPEAPTLA